jgi:hypothetical protein
MVDNFTPALEAHLAGSAQANISRELAELFARVKKRVLEEEITRTSKPGDDVVVTTLGTGSSLPSKYRNG